MKNIYGKKRSIGQIIIVVFVIPEKYNVRESFHQNEIQIKFVDYMNYS